MIRKKGVENHNVGVIHNESIKKLSAHLKDKRLLVISSYPSVDKSSIVGTFVKDQVDLVKDYFKEVIVIDSVPYVPSFMLKLLPKRFRYLIPLLKKRNYTYDNVRVYTPKFLTLPVKKELFDRFRITSIKRTITEEKIEFDLIHANFTWPGGYLGAKLKDTYEKPLVVSVRGDPFRSLVVNDRRVYKRSKKKILYSLERADIITTPHPELYGYLCDLNFGHKSEVVYKHMDFKKFDNMEEYGKEVDTFVRKNNLKGKIVVTFLANFYPPKDPLTFVRAIPYVLEKLTKDELNGITFLMVGDGILMPEVLEETKRLDIKKYCQIVGQIAETQIVYMCSDVFCAISPIENIWSSTVMEAMSSGVPIIATKAGTTEQYLKHGETAYLIAPISPRELATAILKIINDKKLRESLGHKGKEFAKENWDEKNIVGKWLWIYKKVLIDKNQI